MGEPLIEVGLEVVGVNLKGLRVLLDSCAVVVCLRMCVPQAAAQGRQCGSRLHAPHAYGYDAHGSCAAGGWEQAWMLLRRLAVCSCGSCLCAVACMLLLLLLLLHVRPNKQVL